VGFEPEGLVPWFSATPVWLEEVFENLNSAASEGVRQETKDDGDAYVSIAKMRPWEPIPSVSQMRWWEMGRLAVER
jgi:hypothetical protein